MERQTRNPNWEASLCEGANGCVRAYDAIDSTNLCAKAWAREGAHHGDWVIAAMQTNGRGRLGRTFESPGDAGIYMTVILFPAEDVIPLLTIAAGVAVAEAIESLAGVQPRIKWVNDLLIGGKKVCGILAEGVTSLDGTRGAVVGIGVNLKKEALPESLSAIAGALEGNISRDELAARIRENLLFWANAEKKRAMIEKYRSLSCLVGKTIQYCENGAWKTGFAHDIGENGELIVRDDGGALHALIAGEVTLHGSAQSYTS